jgi:hypothetical protein
MGQIHLKMNREELVLAFALHMRGIDLRAPGMGPAFVSKVFEFAKLYRNRG